MTVQEARVETLEEVLKALKDERSRMEDDKQYVLANVYGMNNAIDKVEEMLEEANE
jgi:predicted nuclease with TOPRIM domain